MITYEQLDAVIPRVPAGINSGDLTDPDERPAFVAQVLGWVLRASTTAPTPERAVDGHTDPNQAVSVAWGVDRAEVTVVPELEALLDEEAAHHRRNAWIHQPPKPGTHESDLAYHWRKPSDYLLDPSADIETGRGGGNEYDHAAIWSQENAR